MASKRIAGVTFLTVDGRQYTLGGSFTVSPSTIMREGKVGLSGVAGYKEAPRIPFLECELHTTDGLSVEELDGITDATAKVELANGKIYVFTDCWSLADSSVDAAEGTVGLKIEAFDCQEIAPAS